ncbi:hypothetical protein Q5M85_02440 [Paraclostridium bifermentans]|nr:hypothetical protein [Paraclostridium bifermentans]
MFGAIAKSYLAEKINKKPEDMYVVAECLVDKKLRLLVRVIC